MNKSNINFFFSWIKQTKFFFSFKFWVHYILHSHRNSPSWQWSQGRGWYIPLSGPPAAPPCLLRPRPPACCCCMIWLRASRSLCTNWRQEHRLGTPEHLSWPANLTPISEYSSTFCHSWLMFLLFKTLTDQNGCSTGILLF